MWLKIEYSPSALDHYDFRKNEVAVSIISQETAPIYNSDRAIRISPIFPLRDSSNILPELNGDLYFFEFANPFRVLGRIRQSEQEDLKDRVFFSCGSCSVLLFVDSEQILDEFQKLELGTAIASEQWTLQSGLLAELPVISLSRNPAPDLEINDYTMLPMAIRTIVDEFAVSVRLNSYKCDSDGNDGYILRELVAEVNRFVDKLILLYQDSNPEGNLNIEGPDPASSQVSIGQLLDRLIQINSALSYVSTQMFSGAVPILERRSLIRRNSLLGIGTAMAALNRVVKYVEDAFFSVNFAEIIVNHMSTAAPLPGLETPAVPIRKDWHGSNIGVFKCKVPVEPQARKLAYFSSRYGFRESQYAVTAALTALANGLSLPWSLMTITHELLHSHVRVIFDSILYTHGAAQPESFKRYYSRYLEKVVQKRQPKDYKLIDSVREVIFTYCCRTLTQGSITSVVTPITLNTKVPIPETEGEFYGILESEYRNINEIFAHVLDFHYFYRGKVAKYIPLIWCSWSSVPAVVADLRQYILRSLLVIASNIDAEPTQRWTGAIEKFRSVIEEHEDICRRFPLLLRVKQVLSNNDLLRSEYFGTFKNGLLLVDLILQVFHSSAVGARFSDENVTPEVDDASLEDDLSYAIEDEFIDLPIDAPIAYLYDRLSRILDGKLELNDIERSTTVAFLAMNSSN